MPYIVIKKDGKRHHSPFVFTERDIENLARDPDHCYTLLSPITMRTRKVGGKCRKRRR